jgi:phenylalanyl-tRNA synthetase alpha chain
MGFDVAQGPEIETDWFNSPPPTRRRTTPSGPRHDTFYVEGELEAVPNLLRTHTSPYVRSSLRRSAR